MPMQVRWRLLVLACVLASLLVPALASASPGPYAETRVRGLDLGNSYFVGAARAVTLGTHQGYASAYDGLASDFLLAARGATRLLPEVTRSGQLTQQGLEHIVSRHWATAGTRNAGHFAGGTTARGLRGMIDDALEHGAIRPNIQGRPGHIFEFDFGRTIGTNAAGDPTSMLRVVRAPTGGIITAFPF